MSGYLGGRWGFNSLFSLYCVICLCRLNQAAGGGGGGAYRIFQDMDGNARIIKNEYPAMVRYVIGATNNWMNLVMANI